MHQVVSKFVPLLLTQDFREPVALPSVRNFWIPTEDENFPKRIISGDETWVYEYDAETKMQSS
jgi:hypothetical protein